MRKQRKGLTNPNNASEHDGIEVECYAENETAYSVLHALHSIASLWLHLAVGIDRLTRAVSY